MEGRIVAAAAMAAGVGLFGAFTGFLASWFLEPEGQRQESELAEIRERLAAIERRLDALLEARQF